MIQKVANILSILKNLRNKALKKRLHEALNEHERLLTLLIGKHAKIAKNATLATIITKIVVKIINTLRGISKHIFILGFETRVGILGQKHLVGIYLIGIYACLVFSRGVSKF